MSDLPSKSNAHAVDGQAYERAQEVVAVKPKRKWQSYIWDTFDKSPEERKFLFKIDTALLTLASFGMWNSFAIDENTTDTQYRLLYQVPRSIQHQQCLCLWNVSAIHDSPPPLHVQPYLTQVAMEIHSTFSRGEVSTESRETIDSPWTSLPS